MTETNYMKRALALAARGRGKVEPNPMVGCVLVREGAVVGEGYHRRFGGDHAEVDALNHAGEAARGATCYVTLEPCCHQGKTPPCTDALVRAGVARVVAAMGDPFARVKGRGFDVLFKAGVEVSVGLCAAEAQALNAPYLKLVGRGLPYVTCKWAMSVDGKVATCTGDSRWISGEKSRREVHRLRTQSDVVMVGVGTVLADDPSLNVRHVRGSQPAVAVVDSTCRTPTDAKLFVVRDPSEVTLYCTEAAPVARREALQKIGVEVVEVPSVDGRVDLGAVLAKMGHRRVTNLFVEGGPTLHGALLGAGLVDRVVVFVAPKLIGGAEAPGGWQGQGIDRMTDALNLADVRWRRMDDDMMMVGRLSD